MYYTQMDFVLLTNGCENRATPLIWLDTLQALHTIGHCEGCCCTRTTVIFRCVHLFQHKLVEMSCAGNANQNRILKGEINFSGKYWGCFPWKRRHWTHTISEPKVFCHVPKYLYYFKRNYKLKENLKWIANRNYFVSSSEIGSIHIVINMNANCSRLTRDTNE